MHSWDHLSSGTTQYYLPPTEAILCLYPRRVGGTHLLTPKGWKAELTWALRVKSWLRTVMRRYHRCQLFNRHAPLSRCVCERLAQGRYLAADRPRIKPATFWSLIRRSSHYSTRPKGKQHTRNHNWSYQVLSPFVFSLQLSASVSWILPAWHTSIQLVTYICRTGTVKITSEHIGLMNKCKYCCRECSFLNLWLTGLTNAQRPLHTLGITVSTAYCIGIAW